MNKEKLFREKIAILNAEFVEYVTSSIKDNPSYDLSPPVQDYLNHVIELDKMYAERPVLSAVRRIKTKTSENNGAPKRIEPKVVANGIVEPAGQFSFAPKIQMPALRDSAVTATPPTFSMPKSANTSLSGGSRKRRPGEALDYDKMKSVPSELFGMADKPASDNSVKSTGRYGLFDDSPGATKDNGSPASQFSFAPKTQMPAVKDPAVTASSLFSGFSKTPAFSFKPAEPANAPEPAGQSSSAPKTQMIALGSPAVTASSLFSGVSKTPSFSFKPAESGNASEPAGQFSLSPKTQMPTLGGPAVTASSLFSGFSKTSSFSFKPSGPDNASEPSGQSLFASKTQLPALGDPAITASSLFSGVSKTPSFSFKPTASVNAQISQGADEKNEGDGEGENQPPTVLEVVKHDDPDAVFSTKCSLYNLADGEYQKMGTGFIYIKKLENGTQLLIRSATSTGNVLVNTFINDSFNTEGKDKNRIQFSYLTEDGLKKYLVKVVDYQNTLDYFTKTKKP